ncbi:MULTISPECIES: Hsp20/alpha crystallin family protein [Haloferax]|uniref:Hsp20/alpha crystallin family protein n=1 Tax=Haloferax TaxID=2251 RepID=UPI001781895B|nr:MULTISPECIES: Hsp20/alpha crystallin family protein [Haloferax]
MSTDQNVVDRIQDRFTARSEDRSFPVDIEARPKEFVVTAELPGVKKQDIDVTVHKNRLRIATGTGGGVEGTLLQRERSRGQRERIVRLPGPVDQRHVSASYNDGVLWVTLKKRGR